jgi:hypothetical protein
MKMTLTSIDQTVSLKASTTLETLEQERKGGDGSCVL